MLSSPGRWVRIFAGRKSVGHVQQMDMARDGTKHTAITRVTWKQMSVNGLPGFLEVSMGRLVTRGPGTG